MSATTQQLDPAALKEGRSPGRLRGALGAMTLSFALAFPAYADPIKIKMAEIVRSGFFVPMYVALGKGFAKEENLEVELITANGGSKVGALVLGGGADIGLAGPEVPVYIYNSESPDKPVIICALTGTDGFFLASRQKIDNFQWSMVHGKVLVYAQGSTPNMVAEHVFKKNGVDPSVLQTGLITNVSIPARDGAWISGQGDFGIFQDPDLAMLEKAGHLHVLKSMGAEVGRADYTVFFVNKSWLQKNPAIAQAWTNAMAKTDAWMRTATSREIAEVVNPFFPSAQVADTQAAIDRYRGVNAPIWSETPLVDRAGLENLQKIMVEGKTLKAEQIVPYDAIVDAKFANNAAKMVGSKTSAKSSTREK